MNDNQLDYGKSYDESNIYRYVQKLHRNKEDFYDGNLGERLGKYKMYQLLEIPINKIKIDQWQIDDDKVSEYVSLYEKNKKYPPIVLKPIRGGSYEIIDGTHRVNALDELGYKYVDAYVGIK